MVSPYWFPRLIRWPTTLVMLYAVNAGGAGPELVDHSFQFDTIRDSPGISVLDYRYGNSKIPGARSPEGYIREGRPRQSASITGPMQRGDSLWVKWKVIAEDRIYEDTVDLESRLPRNIEHHIVYFKVESAQLYVYLVSPERRNAEEPSAGPRKYRHRKVTVIYPDQKK